jgi:hypothetical protein
MNVRSSGGRREGMNVATGFLGRRPNYRQVKADLAPEDAAILERLVEDLDSPLAVVTDLQAEGCVSQTEAFARMRRILRQSMERLRTRVVLHEHA